MRKKLAFIFISFALLIAFIPTAVAAAPDYESESYTARPQAGGSEYEGLDETESSLLLRQQVQTSL